MIDYPYNIPSRPYRGTDKAKHFKTNQINQTIMRVNQYIQSEMSLLNIGDEKIFNVAEIAEAIGITFATAQDIISGIDGGQHGVTFVRVS